MDEKTYRTGIAPDGTPVRHALVGVDGTARKPWYGEGRQPWDDMKEIGWAQDFAAASIFMYLRRTKDPEQSIESARWYWVELEKLSLDRDYPWHPRANIVIGQLMRLLTVEEKRRLTP